MLLNKTLWCKVCFELLKIKILFWSCVLLLYHVIIFYEKATLQSYLLKLHAFCNFDAKDQNLRLANLKKIAQNRVIISFEQRFKRSLLKRELRVVTLKQ